ncbi:MAG: ABC transporter permease [Treponema sp.]|nr:ABC transporter permease [Treponema sp.]
MSKLRQFINKTNWIFEISRRFSRVDRNGRSQATSKLATLGICFGVMTLIVVMSIMNGFQMSFIDSIMEISSYHIRVSKLDDEHFMDLYETCDKNKEILSVTGFYEAQTLMAAENEKEQAALIRAVDPSIYWTDKGFSKELKMINGSFVLDDNSIVLGSTLARKLSVRPGDKVNLFVLSGSDDVELFSSDRIFTVTGIFTCGYSEINSSYCFISLADGMKYFGNDAKIVYGIKLKESNADLHAINILKKSLPQAKYQSWREYNKTFFGALRIEKNMLLILVAIIFLVVGVNIYNGMRRLVFERRNEIAILSAIGARSSNIQSVFVMRGFFTGLIGSFSGVILGLLISVNSSFVFITASKIMYSIQYIITAFFNPENLMFVHENSLYAVYAGIDAKIILSEVVMIALFGIAAPLFASWAASKNVLKLTVAEVLHDE